MKTTENIRGKLKKAIALLMIIGVSFITNLSVFAGEYDGEIKEAFKGGYIVLDVIMFMVLFAGIIVFILAFVAFIIAFIAHDAHQKYMAGIGVLAGIALMGAGVIIKLIMKAYGL